jgi:hypothetical protein
LDSLLDVGLEVRYKEMGLLIFVIILMVVLLAGLVLAGLAFGGSYLLNQILGRASGLERLAEMYPAVGPPQGKMYRRQWVAVGGMNYINTATVSMSQEGLYLWVKPFLSKYRPALIPWGELMRPQRTVLTWQRAVRWEVGEPKVATVVFTARLVEKMAPYVRVAGR